MGLSGSREANAASGGDAAYHAYGRAAASSSSSATRVSRDDVPPSSMPATDGNASDDERLVPSLFTWTFGGQNVSVTGAWDGWRQKTPMERNGTEWSVVIFIPSGEYHFKYVVDGPFFRHV